MSDQRSRVISRKIVDDAFKTVKTPEELVAIAPEILGETEIETQGNEAGLRATIKRYIIKGSSIWGLNVIPALGWAVLVYHYGPTIALQTLSALYSIMNNVVVFADFVYTIIRLRLTQVNEWYELAYLMKRAYDGDTTAIMELVKLGVKKVAILAWHKTIATVM